MEKFDSSPKFNPWYITGLVEGEGCFSVSFNFRSKLSVGIETRPSFSLSLNKRDLSIIQKLHLFFGCGGIRFSKTDRTYKYEVRSISDLMEKIIPHFDQFPLQGNKEEDFGRFKKICRLVHSNHHLSGKFLREIIEDAYQMNYSGKRKHKKEELLKVLKKSKD